MHNSDVFDTIIIGGSFAGLSAAMSLGRACRRVLIIDSGNPCNRYAAFAQNMLTHDGDQPAAIAALAKQQVEKYQTVTFIGGTVTTAKRVENYFEITTAEAQQFRAKKLLFATGLVDILPDLPGFRECWGTSILHCPYCHGYEFNGQPTGIMNHGDTSFGMAKTISQWTDKLTVFTQEEALLSDEERATLERKNITVIDIPITHLEHDNGYLHQVVLADETRIPMKVIYAHPPHRQQCDLPAQLGCAMTDQGTYEADIMQRTGVPGIYVAGDNSSHGRALSVAIAAGSIAGMYINKEIVDEEFDTW